jgi:hypothetical protein
METLPAHLRVEAVPDLAAFIGQLGEPHVQFGIDAAPELRQVTIAAAQAAARSVAGSLIVARIRHTGKDGPARTVASTRQSAPVRRALPPGAW